MVLYLFLIASHGTTNTTMPPWNDFRQKRLKFLQGMPAMFQRMV